MDPMEFAIAKRLKSGDFFWSRIAARILKAEEKFDPIP